MTHIRPHGALRWLVQGRGARFRARAIRTARPAARCLAVRRAPRSPPSFATALGGRFGGRDPHRPPKARRPHPSQTRKPRIAFSMSKTRALLALSIIELSINRFNGVARNRNCLTLTSYHAVPLPSKKLLSATAVCCSLLHTSQQPTRKTMAHLATRMHHRPRSLRPPRQSYHTIYKFGGGPRNEAHLPEFLPPSCPPRVFPELREARSARNASWRTQLAAVCRQQSLAGEARVQGQQGRGVRVLSLMGNSSLPC